jgi:hypothetical protein
MQRLIKNRLPSKLSGKAVMRLIHTCFRCHTLLPVAKYYDGDWKQGNQHYMTLRCPLCFHYNGRIELDQDYTAGLLELVLKSVMMGQSVLTKKTRISKTDKNV